SCAASSARGSRDNSRGTTLMTTSPSPPTLLVIDGDPVILDAFQHVVAESAIKLLTASSGSEGLQLFARHRPGAVVLDPALPDLPGLNVFHRIRELDPGIPVIFLAQEGTAQATIEAVKQGAHDFLLKPLPILRMRELIASALQIGQQAQGVVALTEGKETEGLDSFVGRCPAIQEVYKAIGRVAPKDVNVLILGESGTGKELVARAIY